MLQLGHIFSWRQQEQNGVEVAFFWDNAVFTQEVRQNGRWHTKGVVLAVTVNAWRGQQQFAWVDKILMLSVAFKAVPAAIENAKEKK